MMSLKDFIKKYTGVKCGNTEANFGECVGLAMLWTENLGFAHTWGHAHSIYANAKTTDFQKIPNSPNSYPVAGDLMCWDQTTGGGFGHIAVVTESNAGEDSFTVFEQNNPFGSPPKITKYKKWNGVIGWLRPKVLAEQTNECEKKVKELEKELQETTQEKDRYKDETRDNRKVIKDLEKQLAERDSLVENIKKINKELEQYLNDQKIENANLSNELSEVKVELGNSNKNVLKCQNELSKCMESKECTLEDFIKFVINKLKDIYEKIRRTKVK